MLKVDEKLRKPVNNPPKGCHQPIACYAKAIISEVKLTRFDNIHNDHKNNWKG